MTKKLDNFFNVDTSEDLTAEQTKELAERANQQLVEIDSTDKELLSHQDLAQHEHDMDDIAQEAMASYSELMEKGGEAEDKDAGRIFTVAAQMLKNAIDAKNSKVNAKLKKLELELKIQKLADQAPTDQTEPGNIIYASREDILKQNQTKK